MTKAPVYYFRSGFRIKGDPQTIGEHLQTLKRGDDLYPEDVVKDARRKNSPLYSCFEWDNKKAAHEYRLIQARTLIRSLEVKYEEGDYEITVMPFVSVKPGPSTPSYTDIRVVMGDSDKREQMLERVKSEFRGLRRRYDMFQELATVYEAIDSLP